MACNVNQSAVVEGEFEAFTCKPCVGYPRCLAAAAVVDCSISHSALEDCGLSRSTGINA